VQGAAGAIAAIGEQGMIISAQGAQIEVSMVRPDEGKKLAAAQFCAQAGLKVGTVLGA
jgi:methionyl-tRNA formyltransferase